ncbi:transporter substrate-binding domain-containing protein [Acidomonas methanolica]|uniref:ABC transporter n=1 Tax=Acidomonas methanolica NBRC 104435 TaxID=1231351 RepID=A0A023D6K8_ACIMT|nr:transporter substrate-binding domain-containing protein [Acidomonas methanolica]MBU2655266.1 transporter substrate-binding domain-containing protein [Acidomonas methanolica]TCS24067.1 amino acid ABC transporter substrate-binding protein (PAAT family) [Acidomonas methanolica]GAJ29778.1 ABC transporter [Acidomonas methanolica NBRC 104435]GBQ51670.1 amino acid ABC transporter permease [Acidomonas methanolica]GEL00108.1 ABC transporter substrate-binding protein [Acidomonas methanolica NBRC 1044
MTAPGAGIAAELVPTGTLRVGINFGNPVLAQKDPEGGPPRGVSADLAREVARRLGVGIRFVTFDAAAKVVEAAARNEIDLLFLAVDPVRGREVLYTAPYVVIEGTYLVGQGAPYHDVAALDAPGVRIAVGKGAAYDLYLSRALRHATLARAETSSGAVDLFVREGLEAAAGVRQPLEAYAAAHPGYRVIPGRFTAIEQAVATPRGREVARAWLHGVVEEAKASGFVRDSLAASGQSAATVAEPAKEFPVF